jgi:adenylylsulfate kinase
VCETRDVKGLYKKARSGEIKDFSGLSAPYQVPINPDIEVKTDNQTLEESVDQILNYLKQKTNIFND